MGKQRESQNVAHFERKKGDVENHDMKKKLQLSVCSFVLLFRFALSRPLSLAVDRPRSG
jgi:hypothetical protein